MEGYYSSDDDVAWGPYTLREAKRDIREGLPSKTDRRHTYSGPLNSNKKSFVRKNQQLENKDEMNGKVCISDASSSDYFTPNDTFKSGPTSVDEFLDKMMKVIEEPTETEAYATATDDQSTDATETDAESKDEFPSEIQQNFKYKSFQDQSMLNFLKLADQRPGKISMFGNIEPTLVENTIIISSDEEEVDYKIVKQENTSNSYMLENTCYETSSEVEMIEMDDTSDTHATANMTNLDNSMLCSFSDIKTEGSEEYDYMSLQIDPLCNNSKIVEHDQDPKVEEEIAFSSLESVNGKADIENIIKHLSKDLQIEDSASASSIGDSDFSDIKNVDTQNDIASESHQVPKIHISSYDTSSNSQDSSHVFNDTLEEIEMVLKYGLDYKMPVDFQNFPSHETSGSSNQESCSTNDEKVCAGSPLTHVSPKYTSDHKHHEVASHIPRLKNTPKKPTETHIVRTIKPEAQSNFKVPNILPKHKVTPIKSPLSQTNKFKDIMSPVGIYIKQSPAPFIKRNIISKDMSNKPMKKTPEAVPLKNIENASLPQVVYKPSRNKIVFKEKEVVLPKSIKKLICEPEIIKSEARIAKKAQNISVNTQLEMFEDDLTCLSIDENTLDMTGDTSILCKKQGFIK